MKIATEIIQAEIGANGAISFARFMDLALYCPGSGFYEKEKDTIGKGGDFYTSVSVGGLFGELLAFQFTTWVAESRREGGNGPFQVVEIGAHHGRLAADILGWLSTVGASAGRHNEAPPYIYADSVEYWIVEPSDHRRARQEEALGKYAGRVHWVNCLSEIAGGVRGVIFSNELLDAMPVHLHEWDATVRQWYERGVTWKNDRFVWTRLKQSPVPMEIPTEILAFLPDGYIVETSPTALKWWHEAARSIRSGRLLTFDYGFAAEEFPSPARKDGTVRAYHRHKLVEDVLANPGEQDITAHVNFPAIQAAGESEGLRTEAFELQSKFLTTIAANAWREEGGFGPWTPAHTRQFQTLTHPEHLGRAFRVLLQVR